MAELNLIKSTLQMSEPALKKKINSIRAQQCTLQENGQNLSSVVVFNVTHRSKQTLEVGKFWTYGNSVIMFLYVACIKYIYLTMVKVRILRTAMSFSNYSDPHISLDLPITTSPLPGLMTVLPFMSFNVMPPSTTIFLMVYAGS